MAAKKVYAVKKGRKTGIFKNWEDCKASIEGFSGAEYKGFKSLEDANAYLNDSKAVVKKSVQEDVSKIIPESPDKIIAYVDGSYENSIQKYSFGCVFILPDGKVYTESGNGDNPDSLALRNVTGEMLGAMFAVRFAMVNGFRKIDIHYDYEGVEKWVTGAWKSKTDLTQKYAKAMQGWSRAIEISFTKVAAHTNVYYNEMADQLAKEALIHGNGIPEIQKLQDISEK